MAAPDRRADAAHLGRQRPAVSEGLCARLSAPDPRLEGRRSSRIAGICRRSSSGRLSSARWKASSTIRRPRHEILQLPSDAVPARRPRRHREERLGLGHLFQPRLRSEEGRRALSRVSRPDGAGRPARLRRRLPQRAPPDRLRHDADAGRARRRAGALGQARQDRDPRPRAAAAEQPAGDRRRIRDARQPDARPLHRRLRARHRRRISRHGHQPGAVAGALRRGARPHHPRLDRARAVPVRRQALPLQLRESVAAALSDAASADLDSVAGLEQHDQMGGADALHLRADARADRGRGAHVPDVPRRGREGRLRGLARPARLVEHHLHRRDRRAGDARGAAAHGGAGQPLPEDADRDAAAARLQQHRIR